MMPDAHTSSLPLGLLVYPLAIMASVLACSFGRYTPGGSVAVGAASLLVMMGLALVIAGLASLSHSGAFVAAAGASSAVGGGAGFAGTLWQLAPNRRRLTYLAGVAGMGAGTLFLYFADALPGSAILAPGGIAFLALAGFNPTARRAVNAASGW